MAFDRETESCLKWGDRQQGLIGLKMTPFGIYGLWGHHDGTTSGTGAGQQGRKLDSVCGFCDISQ